MAEILSTGLRNSQIEAFGDDWDSGTLNLYESTGTPPADANDAINGVLIASIPLPANAFGDTGTAGAISMLGTWEDSSADNTGDPDYGRLMVSGGTTGASTTEKRLQFSVGGPASGADLELDSATVTAAQVVAISSATATQAAS
jgi:hypothetical protein